MQVAKWGNSLAVRLPAAVVEALQLKEGDEIEIQLADARAFAVAREPGREDWLKRLARFGAHAGGLQVRPRRGQSRAVLSTRTSCSTLPPATPGKPIAPSSVLSSGGAISVQVLNETATVARRKLGMSWAETREFLSGLRATRLRPFLDRRDPRNRTVAGRAVWLGATV